MKKLFLTLSVIFSAATSMAQVDFNDPRFAAWGDTAAEREQNLRSSTFLKEALDSKDYNSATQQFHDLVKNAPAAASSTYARGAILYKNKINRAKSLTEKNKLVDSLMWVYDLRLEYFANDARQGKAYILDLKARDYATYKMRDRAGMRETFRAALDAAGENVKADLAYMYFNNLAQDFQVDEVMADEVLALYEELQPLFDSLTGDDVKYAESFHSIFSTCGAASCENLEALFSRQLEENPNDVDVLTKGVNLLSRSNCTSPFYLTIAERLYKLTPTSNAAMGLAAIFQNSGDYARASKYLGDALATETDIEERERLYSRIALVELAAGNMKKAADMAKAAIATPDNNTKDNGVAFFVLAQAYASSASSCQGFDANAIYWVAFDTMAMALNNFSGEESSYRAPAEALSANFKAQFPSTEECFFQEVAVGSTYRVNCGLVGGVSTTVRTR